MVDVANGWVWPDAWTKPPFWPFRTRKIPYAIDRYVTESKRLYKVLNTQLIGQKFVAGEYSIADMAILPWALRHEWQSIDLHDYPYVQDYIERLTARPAVQKPYR